MRGLYETEVEVYDTLKVLQGKDAPRLFACVTVPGLDTSSRDTSAAKHIDISGILLQYIDGFPLTTIAHHFPRETFQSLCDNAILNEDVNTRSFIVHKHPGPATGEYKYKAFIIDFALCKFRREYGDENDWRDWKALHDKEGAVGCYAAIFKWRFVYRWSGFYRKLDEEFKMDD